MTFDTWTDGMYGLMRAASGYAWIYFVTMVRVRVRVTLTLTLTLTRYAWIYFVTIAFLGGLFVVNLFLCVIFDEFMKSQATHTDPNLNPNPNPNPSS